MKNLYQINKYMLMTFMIHQAYEDLVAPAAVTYEDICSIDAKPAAIHPKPVPAPAKEPAPEPAVSFLGSWVPVRATGDDGGEEEEEKPRREAQRPPRVAKNIHHFCKVGDDVQLPDHFRGVWRRYHVPSKYDYIHKVRHFRCYSV